MVDPSINNFAVTAALAGLAARILDPEFYETWDPDPRARMLLAAQMSFCLATGSLTHRVLNNMPLLSSRVSDLYDPVSDAVDVFREWRDSLEGCQAAALLVITCTCWVLLSDHSVRVRDDLPYPPALPLLNVHGKGGQIPIPDGAPTPNGMSAARSLAAFALAPSWSDWLRNHIDALIDDLAQGEWVGYYTSSFGRSSVDAPLRNIHFGTQRVPEDPDEVRLTADSCFDGVGRFRLEGTVFRRTGKVSLLKIYEGAHSWCNECWLTPLGIAGYWGSTPASSFGLVWMYKREWTKNPAAVGVAELE